jgi:hypothetical protein
MVVFRLPLSFDLVGAALLVSGRDCGLDTTDPKVCEELLGAWIDELLLSVIADFQCPLDLTDIVAELKSRDRQFHGPA